MSEIRVDAIKTRAGAVPKAVDVGLNVTGSVLQVLSTTKTDAFSSSSTSYTDVTGLSLAITPSSTSSKILVICHLGAVSNNNHYSGFRLVRDSTSIGIGTGGGTYNDSFSFYSGGSTAEFYPMSMQFLDSPSTTSETTYKLQFKTSGAVNSHVNKRYDDATFGTASTFTVMEIAG